MDLLEVKERFYDAVAKFFTGATTIWAEQIGTKPKLPYVTLKFGSINRPAFPVEDDDLNRVYQCSTSVEINLYTKGKAIDNANNMTTNHINTATSDLMEFSNYLESDEIIDYFACVGMDVSLIQTVRDLTNLQNDSKYRYRAMAEYSVSFVVNASGKYAATNMSLVPNSSGGGTIEIAEAIADVIDEVIIE